MITPHTYLSAVKGCSGKRTANNQHYCVVLADGTHAVGVCRSTQGLYSRIFTVGGLVIKLGLRVIYRAVRCSMLVNDDQARSLLPSGRSSPCNPDSSLEHMLSEMEDKAKQCT